MGESLWLGLCLLIQGLVKTLFFVNLSKFGCQFLHAQKWLPISKMPCFTPWNCKSWKTAIQIGTIQQTKQCWNISDFEWSLRSKSLRNCNWNLYIIDSGIDMNTSEIAGVIDYHLKRMQPTPLNMWLRNLSTGNIWKLRFSIKRTFTRKGVC